MSTSTIIALIVIVVLLAQHQFNMLNRLLDYLGGLWTHNVLDRARQRPEIIAAATCIRHEVELALSAFNIEEGERLAVFEDRMRQLIAHQFALTRHYPKLTPTSAHVIAALRSVGIPSFEWRNFVMEISPMLITVTYEGDRATTIVWQAAAAKTRSNSGKTAGIAMDRTRVPTPTSAPSGSQPQGKPGGMVDRHA